MVPTSYKKGYYVIIKILYRYIYYFSIHVFLKLIAVCKVNYILLF